MGINAISAASFLKFVVSKQLIRNAKSGGHGKIWRGLHGMTMSSLSHKKVIISNDHYGEGPCTCFWAFINKPKSANDILLKETKGIILAHVTGPISAQGGTVVSGATDIYGQFDTIGSNSNSTAILSQLNEAWKAGVWSSVKGTKHEFAIGLSDYLIGGVAAFVEDEPGVIKVGIRTWNKDNFIKFMGHAERKGRTTPDSINYSRSLANDKFYILRDNKLELESGRSDL